jgi:hypothetical protein
VREVVFKVKSFQFSAKDGTTCASTKVGELFLLPRIQILVNKLLENINIFNIKVSTDKCFESSFSSIRAKIAKIESIEVLELLYTRIIIFNTDDRASVLVVKANASDPHAKAAWSIHELYKCAVEHNFT